MFKNGLGLVSVQGEVPEAGTYQVAPLPQAVLESLWQSWTPGLALSDITAAYATHTQSVLAMSIAEILHANLGRTVRLKTHDQESWIIAEIVSMPDVTPEQPPSQRPPYPVPPQRGDLLVLRNNEGTLAISPSRVLAVRQSEGALNDTVTRTTPATTVRFSAADGRGRDRSVALSYLSKGIAWSPSYVVEFVLCSSSSKNQITQSVRAWL